ncbi:MAG: hypothetical protein ACI4JY_02860 [Oscillospiraceae bacterium]
MDLRDFATGLVFLNNNTKRNQTEAAKSLRRFLEKTAEATPLEGTVRKWITSSEKSKRNCDVRSYYPEPVLEKEKSRNCIGIYGNSERNPFLDVKRNLKK